MSVAGFRLASWLRLKWIGWARGVLAVGWPALMTNSIGLVDDAAVLTLHCSYGRAQALLVLATEELARARFLYGAAEDEWSRSIESDAWIEVLREVVEVGPAPLSQLQVAARYPAGMAAFWEPDGDEVFRFPYSESERDGGEIKKLAGFSVDRAGDMITSPMDIPEGASGCSSRWWLAPSKCTSPKIAHASNQRVRANLWTWPRIFMSRSFRWRGRRTLRH